MIDEVEVEEQAPRRQLGVLQSISTIRCHVMAHTKGNRCRFGVCIWGPGQGYGFTVASESSEDSVLVVLAASSFAAFLAACKWPVSDIQYT